MTACIFDTLHQAPLPICIPRLH